MECQRCPINEAIQAISVLTKTHKASNGKQMSLFQFVRGKAHNKKVADAAAEAEAEWEKFVRILEKKLYPFISKVCLACAETANDDNPTNRGVSFVSMEAMSCDSLAGSITGVGDGDAENAAGGSGDEENGDAQDESDAFFADFDEEEATANTQTGDFIHKNAIRQSTRGSRDGVTKTLPLPVEDKLKEYLHGFAQLTTLEKNLLFHQMVGATLDNFASMNWVCPEMKKRQSKQWASLKWHGLVEKFPIAAVLRNEKPLKGTTDCFNKAYGPDYDQPELDLFSAMPQE